MTVFDTPDVICVPVEGQGVPRHVLQDTCTAATCPDCGRVVVRWSRMGPRDRDLYATGIRAQMAVPGKRGIQQLNLIKLWMRTS